MPWTKKQRRYLYHRFGPAWVKRHSHKRRTKRSKKR